MRTIKWLWLSINIAVSIIIAASVVGCARYAKITYPEKQAEIIWADESLELAFKKYWHMRYQGSPKDLFLMEAPHVQEMINENLYNVYLGSIQKNDLIKIEIQDIQNESNVYVIINCLIFFKMPNGKQHQSFYSDEWVKVGNVWFHVFRDPIVFPELS